MPAHSSVAKVMQGTAFRRLGNCSDTSDRGIALLPHIHVRIATYAGEKYGPGEPFESLCRLGIQVVNNLVAFR